MKILTSLLFVYSRTTSAIPALTRYVRDVLPGTSATQSSTAFELTVCQFVKSRPLAPSLSQAAPLSRLSAWRKVTIVHQTRVTSFSSATKRVPALVATTRRITVRLVTPAHVRPQLTVFATSNEIKYLTPYPVHVTAPVWPDTIETARRRVLYAYIRQGSCFKTR